ncbi:alpha/beta fold hydrolase [Novosphingobium sp.]|uniref:alpha/beta hydrolase family protein n=1 Tax=Novosphingobium sp. TaxID=1874826 RepID=UPI0025E9667E|nr:alpha/beta fold hydrolase [Novosphingobium sp.]
MSILLAILGFSLAKLSEAPVPANLPADLPTAIYTDPPADKAHPARMETIHVPSGGVAINGVAYLPAGAGPHPIALICHGWPGNEKNLDLAQALRRAGWAAVTFNYRGSWGSPGKFRFAQNPEDTAAVLAYLRDPANAKFLGVDPARIVVMGHSMGGWVTARTGASDHRLAGLVMISAGDMGLVGKLSRPALVKEAAADAETLAETSPAIMADELIANSDANELVPLAPKLVEVPLLALTSDDGLAGHTDRLVAAIRAGGGKAVTEGHAATDHGWSDHRIDLEARIIRWLATLPTAPRG